jgi:hypothetical protein
MKLTIISYSLRHPEDAQRGVADYNKLANETNVIETQLVTVGDIAHLHVFHYNKPQAGDDANV